MWVGEFPCRAGTNCPFYLWFAVFFIFVVEFCLKQALIVRFISRRCLSSPALENLPSITIWIIQRPYRMASPDRKWANSSSNALWIVQPPDNSQKNASCHTFARQLTRKPLKHPRTRPQQNTKKGHSRINGYVLCQNLISFTTKFTTRFGT